MKKSIAKESPHGRMARRVGAAGVALATTLVMAGCHEARGGGYIDKPVDSGVLSVFTGTANFGFSFTCDADQIKGEITYHDDPSQIELADTTVLKAFPEIRLHGDVEKVLVDDDLDIDTPAIPADTCEDIVESQWAHFQGTYWSQDTTRTGKGTFNVLVFDQGEPSFEAGIFDGDGFSIDLKLGPYADYTRAGNIEGGNIQVDN